MDVYSPGRAVTSTTSTTVTVTAMMRVRRWRWWPFAHKYVPAPRVPWGEMFVVRREDLGPEAMQVMAAGVEGLIVKRGGA